MWEFDSIGQYGNLIHPFTGLASTGTYYQGILGSVQPTIDFMYHNVLLNPIFLGLLLVLLVLSLFTFGD